jgi:succinyl-diaminopimelate desuccinylase
MTKLEDILTDLIAFETVHGNEPELAACFDYLEGFLSDRQLHVERHNSDGYPSLMATSLGTKKPKVLLQAHMDVVPAHKPSFVVEESAGKLHGRGTYDMKFAAACYLLLAEELKNELSDYDFGLMLTSDEEIGGNNGVKMLLDAGYSTEVCILPDGGDNWAIETACNGVWIVYLKASGKSAHGSRPWEGENAIDKVLIGVEQIKQLFDGPERGKSTITLSQVEGGAAVNQVPDSARATLDIRFASEEDRASLRTKIEATAKSAGLEIETCAEVDMCLTDLNEPHVAEFVNIVERLRGQPIEETQSLGSSDARYFALKEIPTILIRPNGGGAHSEQEWIDKAGLHQFYEVIKAYVTETAKKLDSSLV